MSDREVYEAVAPDLTRFATALVGPDEARDVVSAVIVRVLERDGGLSGLRDPRPYLMRAVVNEARSRFRERKRRPQVSLEGHDVASDRWEVDHLAELIDRLPPRQRAATFLVYYQGWSGVEVAELLGCRPATVRRYLHLARRRLREVLDE